MFQISNSREDFLYLAQKLYIDDPFYMARNEDIPKDAKLFVVKNGDEILARCALLSNPLLKYYTFKTAQLGFFEAVDDYRAVDFLFDQVKKYAKKDYQCLIGPINGSTWKKYRITMPSNNPPFLLDNYNKPYYHKFFESSGFETIASYSSTIFENLNRDYSRVEKFEQFFESRNVKFEHFNIENFEEDIKKIYEISLKSFVNNFLYTPLDFDEFYRMYEPVRNAINPKWIIFAIDNNKPVGFVFAYENLFSKEKKSLVIKTLAHVPDVKYRGLGSFMVEYMHKVAHENGFDNVIHALMHQYNVSANILSPYSKPYQSYKLYGIKL